MCGGKLRLGAGGIKPGEHCSACHEAKALQKNALRQRSMRYGTGSACGGSKGREIHMGGDIHLSGGAERISRLARAHGLQAITKSALRRAIINQ